MFLRTQAVEIAFQDIIIESNDSYRVLFRGAQHGKTNKIYWSKRTKSIGRASGSNSAKLYVLIKKKDEQI